MEIKEFYIESVENTETHYIITFSSGYYKLDKKYNIIPKKGDKVSFIINIMNFIGVNINDGSEYFNPDIRGVCINNDLVFFDSDQEIAQRAEEDRKRAKQERLEKFLANREQMDKDYDALPELFRNLIDQEREDPEFRVWWEDYYLFCCKEAMKILEILKTPQEIKRFNKKSLRKQQAMVPTLSDTHSGHTFNSAVCLAYYYSVNMNKDTDVTNKIKCNIAKALKPFVGKDKCIKLRSNFLNRFKK